MRGSAIIDVHMSRGEPAGVHRWRCARFARGQDRGPGKPISLWTVCRFPDLLSVVSGKGAQTVSQCMGQ